MVARGPKIAKGVWKGVCPYIFRHSRQLLLNRFFNSSTLSMKKVYDGEKHRRRNEGEGEEKKRMLDILATNVVTNGQPKHRQTVKPTARANSILSMSVTFLTTGDYPYHSGDFFYQRGD